ncbi:hypothetical protein [Streptomyces sp. NPDC012616]|uniref:helix-turn-helix domain-containing protein n=1 Tax=Streptomyces sp. NPDC012616 TaxID=3364840 RepID=UPI0036EB8372
MRSPPCPADDPVGAAVQRVHVLREHRGACHLASVRQSGLSAREAMIISLGVEEAAHYGWPQPCPVAVPLIPRWRHAERLTAELQASLYATLTHRQRTCSRPSPPEVPSPRPPNRWRCPQAPSPSTRPRCGER